MIQLRNHRGSLFRVKVSMSPKSGTLQDEWVAQVCKVILDKPQGEIDGMLVQQVKACKTLVSEEKLPKLLGLDLEQLLLDLALSRVRQTQMLLTRKI